MFGRILCRCRHRSARSRKVRRPRRTAGDFGPEGKEAIQLRDSTIAEVIILAITYLGAFVSIRFLSATVSTWHSLVTESGRRFTLAGCWYALISLPICQFLVLPVAVEKVYLVSVSAACFEARLAADTYPSGSSGRTRLFG